MGFFDLDPRFCESILTGPPEWAAFFTALPLLFTGFYGLFGKHRFGNYYDDLGWIAYPIY